MPAGGTAAAVAGTERPGFLDRPERSLSNAAPHPGPVRGSGPLSPVHSHSSATAASSPHFKAEEETEAQEVAPVPPSGQRPRLPWASSVSERGASVLCSPEKHRLQIPLSAAPTPVTQSGLGSGLELVGEEELGTRIYDQKAGAGGWGGGLVIKSPRAEPEADSGPRLRGRGAEASGQLPPHPTPPTPQAHVLRMLLKHQGSPDLLAPLLLGARSPGRCARGSASGGPKR